MKAISLSTVLTLLAVLPVHAAVYTYSEDTSTTTEWAAGTSWDAVPVSAADTTLAFSGILPAGTAVVSDNDIAGNFLLNKLDFLYTGPASGTAPMLNLTGNPLEFTGAAARLTLNPAGTVKPSLTVGNDLVLSANLEIYGTTAIATPVTFSGKITGSSNLLFTGNAGASQVYVLSNPLNDYEGNTTVNHTGTSSGSRVLRTGADEVIPHGAGKGNLVVNATRGCSVQLHGNNETVNGLVAAFNVGGADSNQRVWNGAVTDATLTVGAADASATFVGGLVNGGSGKLNVVKIGAGTQVLAGRSTYTGTTTVSGGVLQVDYNFFSPTATSSPANFFPSGSDLVLDGGTLAIQGRTDGAAIEQTGVSLGQYNENLTLSNANASQLMVGQELFFEKTGGGGIPATDVFIMAKGAPGATTTTLFVNKRVGGTGGSVATVTTVATEGMTTQAVKSLTLSGAAGSNSTIDFGTSDRVVLTVNAAPVQTHAGSTLTIANWSGVAETGGGAERLMFVGAPVDFSSVFAQSEIVFEDFGPGYKLVGGDGVYEVVAKLPPSGSVLILR